MPGHEIATGDAYANGGRDALVAFSRVRPSCKAHGVAVGHDAGRPAGLGLGDHLQEFEKLQTATERCCGGHSHSQRPGARPSLRGTTVASTRAMWIARLPCGADALNLRAERYGSTLDSRRVVGTHNRW